VYTWDGKKTYILLEDYLKKYYTELVPDWNRILEKLVYKAFDIRDENTYKMFLESASLKYFDYKKMEELYVSIKVDLDFFEEDILKYIAYIATYGYFERIGNPNWHVWLNAKNINKPFEKHDEYDTFSIVEVMGFKYGNNAIRSKLLSALEIIYGSFA